MKKFNELYRLAEANTPGSSGFFGSQLGRLGNTATKIGNTLSTLDPKRIANKIEQIHQAGAIGAAAMAATGVGEWLSNAANDRLNKFLLSLALPNGWPKKGDKVLYHGIRVKDIQGVVDKVNPIRDTLVITINLPRGIGGSSSVSKNVQANTKPGQTSPGATSSSPGSNPEDRVATVVHNIKAAPFYSVTEWAVQIYKPDGWVSDNDEMGHKPTFTWNKEKGVFFYNQDDRGKPPVAVIFAQNIPAALQKIGSQVRGVSDTNGNLIEGKIIREDVMQVPINGKMEKVKVFIVQTTA